MEYIETYFNEELSPERKKEFERRITTDLMFAEEVAFYLSTKQVVAEETMKDRERLKEIYTEYKLGNRPEEQKTTLLRKLWPWAAAAAILAGIIFGWNAWFNPSSPKELAGKFVEQNFQTFPVTMGDNEDSLQAGLRFYNEGRMEEALKQFERMVMNDTSFVEAKKYAGIVSLQLGQYEKAINYFSQIANAQLYANPGKFYHAITLMIRNLPGDKETAKQLLQQVVENDLVGKDDAAKWLAKW